MKKPESKTATKTKSTSDNGSQRKKQRKLEATDKQLKQTITAMINRVEKRVTLEPFNAFAWRSSDEDITYDFTDGDMPLYPEMTVDNKRFNEIVDRLSKSPEIVGEISDLKSRLCDYNRCT